MPGLIDETDSGPDDETAAPALDASNGPEELPGDRQIQAPQTGLDALGQIGQQPADAPAPEAPATPATPAVDANVADTAAAGNVAANEGTAEALEDKSASEKLALQDQEDKADKDAAALNAAQQKGDEIEGEIRGQKFGDVWDNVAGGNKIAATIFRALGTLGSAATAGLIGRVVDTENNRIYREQVLQLKSKENLLKLSRDGETDLAGRLKQEEANLRLRGAARTQATADYTEAQLIRRGATPEQAAQNTDVAKLRASAAQQKAKAQADKAKAAVEADYKAAQSKELGARAQEDVAKAGYYRRKKDVGATFINPVALSGAVADLRAGVPAADVIGKYNLDAKSAKAAQGLAHVEGTDVDKKEAGSIKDPWTGDTIGQAASPRGAAVARKGQAQGVQLIGAIDKYQKFLEEKGTKNWRPEDVARAKNLWADAVGQRRVWSELPASEAGLELEKAQFGGKPVAWDVNPTSISVIKDMKREVEEVTRMRSNILAGKPANYVAPKKAGASGENKVDHSSLPDGATGKDRQGRAVVRQGGRWVLKQ